MDRIRGPASVTDLGLRYLLGLSETAQDTQLDKKPGCFLLEVSFIKSSYSCEVLGIRCYLALQKRSCKC